MSHIFPSLFQVNHWREFVQSPWSYFSVFLVHSIRCFFENSIVLNWLNSQVWFNLKVSQICRIHSKIVHLPFVCVRFHFMSRLYFVVLEVITDFRLLILWHCFLSLIILIRILWLCLFFWIGNIFQIWFVVVFMLMKFTFIAWKDWFFLWLGVLFWLVRFNFRGRPLRLLVTLLSEGLNFLFLFLF